MTMPRKPLIIGHRGAMAYEPENTLRSFRRALELGADGVEFDVHLSKDEVPVVIHDSTLDRTTNGKGDVHAFTARQLQGLDAGKGEHVPTLREVIEEFAGKLVLQAEIKQADAVEPVVRLLEEMGCVHDAWLSSFWHRAMAEAKELNPKVKAGILFECNPVDAVRLARDARADALHPDHRYIDAGLMKAARDAGLAVLAWTANTPQAVDRLLALGADAIASNTPDLVIQRLRGR
jgi:glycerophosphoryl diester phosphodiesterase